MLCTIYSDLCLGGIGYGHPHTKKERQEMVIKVQMILLNALYISTLSQHSTLLLSNQNFIIKVNLKIP